MANKTNTSKKSKICNVKVLRINQEEKFHPENYYFHLLNQSEFPCQKPLNYEKT